MRYKSEELMNRIIEYIDNCYFTYNKVPTMQTISDNVGISKSNVSRYLQEMSLKGMVDLSNGWQSVRTNKMNKTIKDLKRIPIVGEIACGTPVLAEENIESYLTISGNFLGQGNFFALRAKGESMINADINNGDYVVVKQQNTAEEGEIVVALIDDSATLKRYYKDNKKKIIRLHPENDDMEDMYFESIDIQGVVKKIIKDVN